MERTIKVTGKGNIKIKPDLTIISLDFSGGAKEYAETLEMSSYDITEVKAMLVDLDFKKEDLKTTYFSVDSDYESYKDENGNYKSRFIGYKYHQTLKFSFDVDNKMLGKVLYAIAHLRVRAEFHISYSVKDKELSKNLLLKDAVLDAKRKAIVIAEAAEVRLGEIINMDYNFVNIEFVSHYDRLECSRMISDVHMEAPSYDVDIEPDDIEATDNVTLVYEIR